MKNIAEMCANLPFGQSFGTNETGYYCLEQEPSETYSLSKRLFSFWQWKGEQLRERERWVESALAHASSSIGRNTYRSLYSMLPQIKPCVCLRDVMRGDIYCHSLAKAGRLIKLIADCRHPLPILYLSIYLSSFSLSLSLPLSLSLSLLFPSEWLWESPAPV